MGCNRKALEKVVGAVEEKELLDTLKSVAKLRVRKAGCSKCLSSFK